MKLGDDFSRIVLLGDIHGRYDLLIEALRATGLWQGVWTGEDSLLLQTGDLIDRGPQGFCCMDLLMSLSDQAAQAGGRAVSVLGNHELMALAAASGDPNGQTMWRRNGNQALVTEYWETSAQRGDLPSMEGFYHLFTPAGVYGQWILGRPALVKTPAFLMTHAGLTLDMDLGFFLGRVDETLSNIPDSAYLLTKPDDPVWGRGGPFWTRSLHPGAIEETCLREGVEFQVVGHTPGFGARGSVLNVDAGMVYSGQWRAAVWEQGEWWEYSWEGSPRPLDWD